MKSYSLHIGINKVDTKHYQGWDGLLHGCVNDALFYHELAKKEGCLVSKLLLSSDSSDTPTTTNVLGFLDKSVQDLDDGDKLFITYSGHGGVLPDKNRDEKDYQDETWCLFDRQLLDDELSLKFKNFRPGVRIFMISDSCHSGSISRSGGDKTEEPAVPEETVNYLRRFVPRAQLFGTYEANKQIYDPIMRRAVVRDEDIKASVLQLGACQDNEFAMEDGNNGLFTKTMMRILKQTGDVGSYQELLVRTKRALSGIQRPNLLSYGLNHQILADTKPFGSTYTEGSPRWQEPRAEKIVLLIESDNDAVSLATAGEFVISKTQPKTGKAGYVVYECSINVSEPGMYPWDNAYQQYLLLKQKGFPVTCVEPEIILQDALNGEQASADNAPITGNQRLLGLLFSRMFFGKLKPKKTKGVGTVTKTIDDAVMLTMMGLETVYVITKDASLNNFRAMSVADLQLHLSDPANFTAFTSLIKDSIYSSDYLTAHL